MSSQTTLDMESLTGRHWAGIVLAAITGILHLVLGVRFISSGLGISFVLAGLGFFGAIGLVLVNYRRKLVYLIGIPFTAVQVVLYFVVNWPDVLSPIGVFDKVVQVLLIVILVDLYRRAGA